MTSRISILTVQPGISRDGTVFSSRNWIEGEWVRFQRGLPRKMGGYKEIYGTLNNIPRKVFVLPNPPNVNVYIADYNSINYLTINQFGAPIAPLITTRTPALFGANANNNWKFDTMFSTTTNSNVLLAHAAPNLNAIDNTTETPIYYGDALATTPLVSTGQSVSGGMMALHPYLFMYGNDGDVRWSEPSNPTVILDGSRVTGAKIVAGSQTRGGNTSPAGLMWSLDSVIRVTNVGVDFSFDTITDESSIISSNGIIEYDGLFYWIGMDRFLVYNGTVQEVPNNMSTNFFFENVNYAQRQKIWATKIPRFGEIWWHFCKGNSTETNWAIVYNVRERVWYDTPVKRSAGYYTQVFTNPIWVSNDPTEGTDPARYSAWIHETGTVNHAGYNKVLLNNTPLPIRSNIQTPYFSLCAYTIDGSPGGVDKDEYLYRVEPDVNQVSEMSLNIIGKQYSNSDPVVSARSPYIFEQDTKKIDMREQARQMSIQFESNAIDGFYEMGQILTVIKPGDDRP